MQAFLCVTVDVSVDDINVSVMMSVIKNCHNECRPCQCHKTVMMSVTNNSVIISVTNCVMMSVTNNSPISVTKSYVILWHQWLVSQLMSPMGPPSVSPMSHTASVNTGCDSGHTITIRTRPVLSCWKDHTLPHHQIVGGKFPSRHLPKNTRQRDIRPATWGQDPRPSLCHRPWSCLTFWMCPPLVDAIKCCLFISTHKCPSRPIQAGSFLSPQSSDSRRDNRPCTGVQTQLLLDKQCIKQWHSKRAVGLSLH